MLMVLTQKTNMGIQARDTFFFYQQNIEGKKQNANKIDLTPIFLSTFKI
jgi:hypothetical protein